MERPLRLLDQVQVAAPCPASWDEMKGDDRVRHCSQCRHNVYDLSAMTEVEAETLLANRQGRLCVRFYRRQDGKIMTADCAKGVRALRKRAAKRLALAASLVLTAFGCGEQGDKVKRAYGLDVFDDERSVTVGVMAVPVRTPPPVAPAAPKPKKEAPTNSV